MTVWVSPLRDIHGFARRYIAVAGAIAFVGLAILLISDRAGSFYLRSLLAGDNASPLCNFSVVARSVFALSVAMELLTILGLLILAAHRQAPRSKQMARNVPVDAASFPSLSIGTTIAFGAMLLFLHLGLYGIAFHADDVCFSKSPGEIVHHYGALVAFALLYSCGAVFVIGWVMLKLKRSLLTN